MGRIRWIYAAENAPVYDGWTVFYNKNYCPAPLPLNNLAGQDHFSKHILIPDEVAEGWCPSVIGTGFDGSSDPADPWTFCAFGLLDIVPVSEEVTFLGTINIVPIGPESESFTPVLNIKIWDNVHLGSYTLQQATLDIIPWDNAHLASYETFTGLLDLLPVSEPYLLSWTTKLALLDIIPISEPYFPDYTVKLGLLDIIVVGEPYMFNPDCDCSLRCFQASPYGTGTEVAFGSGIILFTTSSTGTPPPGEGYDCYAYAEGSCEEETPGYGPCVCYDPLDEIPCETAYAWLYCLDGMWTMIIDLDFVGYAVFESPSCPGTFTRITEQDASTWPDTTYVAEIGCS